MKIAFLNIYNGVVERGSEIFVTELAAKLSNYHDITVYQTGEKTHEKYKIIQIKNVLLAPHQGFGVINFFYDFAVLIFTILCIPYISKNKYDWVIPINGRLQVLILRLFRNIYRFRILISGHAGVGFDDKWNIRTGKPDIFVALSPKAYVWANGIAKKNTIIKYIPNGIDIAKFSKNIQSEGKSILKPVVICVAALVDYKRVDLVIKAVGMLDGVNLVVVGDGILRNKISEMGKNILGKKFKLIRHISNSEISSLYKQCDVFTLPSKDTEAFGISYLEAMACNLPVVAPLDENRKQIIGDAGVLCNVVDIVQYTKSLTKALNTNYGQKPIDQAKKFSWDKICIEYAKVLSQI
jgi:glycosyltransferase involved in cell wall biosynthesis